jgi:ParB-like chromosome segregation protein Spo0J
LATIAIVLKDLVIPSRKQGAPRGPHADIVSKYAEHLKISKDWPFPPILVTQQVKKDKPTSKWVVLGGGQRVRAAKEVQWAEPIPAETITDGTDPYVESIRDNLRHGEPFNEKERNESFRVLSKQKKMSVTAIADLWNVHKSTVSRVLNEATTTAGRAARSKPATEPSGDVAMATATPTNGAKGTQDVAHWADFLKARYDEIFEFLSDDDNEESAALVMRLAEALNG